MVVVLTDVPRVHNNVGVSGKKDGQANGTLSVTLTRNQMLHFSAQDYEDFIADIMAQRQLTPHEEEIVRKQRRLVRNRESAQASRTRKRQRIEELEDQVRAITREKEAVISELNQAKGANLALQRTTEHLQNLVSRTPILAGLAAAQGPLLSEHNPDTPNAAASSTSSSSSSSPRPNFDDDDDDDDDDDTTTTTTNMHTSDTLAAAAVDSMQLVAVKKEKLLEHDSDDTASDSPRRSTQSVGVMMLLVLLACGLFLNAHQPDANGSPSHSSSMPRLAPLLLHGAPSHLDDATWSSSSSSSYTSTTSTRSASSLGKRSHATMTSTDQAPAQNSTTASVSSPSEPYTTTTTTTTAVVPRRPANLVPTLVEQPEATPSFAAANANTNVLQATIDAAMRQQAAQVGAPLIALLIPPQMLSAALFNASQAGYQLLLPRDLPRAQGF